METYKRKQDGPIIPPEIRLAVESRRQPQNNRQESQDSKRYHSWEYSV